MDVYALFQNLPTLVGSLGGTDGDESIASSVSAANSTGNSTGLPRPSAARILNSAGTFICPVPAQNLTFPYSASDLPDSFSALTWANIPAVNSSGTSNLLLSESCLWTCALKSFV